MESAYSVINYNPTTKQEAELFANKLIDEVRNGEVNALDLHIKLTAMKKAFDTVKDQIADLVLKEAEKYGQKTFMHQSSQISISELGTKYDFGNCKDPVLNELYNQENVLSSAIKDRETFLKALKEKMIYTDPDSGEITEIFPPIKSSTTGVKIILK